MLLSESERWPQPEAAGAEADTASASASASVPAAVEAAKSLVRNSTLELAAGSLCTLQFENPQRDRGKRQNRESKED